MYFYKMLANNKSEITNLTDPFDGFLKDSKYVMTDRDSNFSYQFRSILNDANVEPKILPAKSLRGRDTGYPVPPAQIPASGITAWSKTRPCPKH
ncbi:MAG: hypothetical protein ACI9HK_001288 [Pirellulaceae bacterium]|jgi:hypothetical protein